MTKIKATNRELLNLLHSLYAVSDLKGLKFAIGVSKNIDRLKRDLLYIDKASAPSEEFQKLLDQVRVIESSEEDKDKVVKEIAKLEKKNQKLIDERKAQLQDVDSILDDESEIELVSISEEILPEGITAKQLGGIIKLINN